MFLKLCPVLLVSLLSFLPAETRAEDLAALVEQVDGVDDIAALDFLAPGDLIDLGADGALTLSYLSSCRHERIRGGLVRIGETGSTATGGEIDISVIPCDSQRVVRAGAGAEASVVRNFGDTRDMLSPEPDVIVFSVYPVLKSLARIGSVRLMRLDRDEPERDLTLRNGIGDFRDYRLRLAPDGLYRIINGETDTIFRVDAGAGSGDTAILSRLVVI
ncbi:MAG: hypothetical protein RIM72_19650 [Alphaproteobacteria bacterium]